MPRRNAPQSPPSGTGQRAFSDREPHRRHCDGRIGTGRARARGRSMLRRTRGRLFGGVDPRTGNNFVFYESYNGGMGGSQTTDGADAVSTGTSNAMNIPGESIEMDYPVRVSRTSLCRTRAAAANFRGGLGICASTKCLPTRATVNVRAIAQLSRRAGSITAATAASAHSFRRRWRQPRKR
jgi:N-methylhydantoinase B/oxoprolinase/acetone carboxylase alpha subunit